MPYADRKADYEQRKEAGTLNQPLLDFWQTITHRPPEMDRQPHPMDWAGTPFQNLENQMEMNINSPESNYRQPNTDPVSVMPENFPGNHPVVDDIYKGIHEDIDKQAALAKAKTPNPDESEGEAQVRNAAIDDGLKDPAGSPTVEKLITEKPNASVGEVTAARSTDLKVQAEEAAKKSGSWSESWQEGWDKFTSNVDLFTMGVTLLATNDGSRSFGENLGIAMSAGRDAKLEQEALERSIAQEQFENKQAEMKAKLEERKVADAEKRTGVMEEGLQIDWANAFTRAMEAETAARNAAGGTDYKPKATTPATERYGITALGKAGVSLDQFPEEDRKEIREQLGSLIATTIQYSPSKTNKDYEREADEAVRTVLEGYDRKSSFWGLGRDKYKPLGD